MSSDVENYLAYNLEFLPYQDVLILDGVCFRKVDEYDKCLSELHRPRLEARGAFLPPSGPSHRVTANVQVSRKIKRSVLPWSGATNELNDLCLILSLTTGRNVSLLAESRRDKVFPDSDPRRHQFGESFRRSITNTWTRIKTDSMKSHSELPDPNYELELNRIAKLIRSRRWRRKYFGGYLLFLSREIFVWQVLEKSFLQSVSLWEHLYALHNPREYNLAEESERKRMARIPLNQKLAYLLEEYDFISWTLNDNEMKCLQKSIVDTRNSLAHRGYAPYGKRSRMLEYKFVSLTEKLIAKILQVEEIWELDKSKQWIRRMLSL